MINRFIPERTTQELDERFKLLMQNSQRKTKLLPQIGSHKSPKTILIAGCTVLVAALAGAFITWKFHPRPSGPLTPSVEKQAGFPLFAPKPLPLGLIYDTTPVKVVHGVLSQTLSSIHGKVVIVEQAAPSNLPDFIAMGLKSTRLPAGTSYSGSTGGRPVTIIISNTTLITITADKTVPSDVIQQLSRSLSSLP
jgi:hypothetical protein